MTERFLEEKKIFFKALADQIDGGTAKTDDNNNDMTNKAPDETEENESDDSDMYELNDQIFKDEKSQFKQLKIKVVAEMLFQLRKDTKVNVPAETLAEWLDEHAKDYNIKVITSKKGGDEFELCREISGFRNRVDQFLKIRKARSKSLYQLNSHKKVDLNQLVYKTVVEKREAKIEKDERLEEIEHVRGSSEYKEDPQLYPKNSLRGNKVKAES